MESDEEDETWVIARYPVWRNRDGNLDYDLELEHEGLVATGNAEKANHLKVIEFHNKLKDGIAHIWTERTLR